MSDNIEQPLQEHEWSYYIPSETIDVRKMHITISLPPEVEQRLCQRLNLYSIKALTSDIVLQRNAVNKVIHITGKLTADVEQKCVVTSDPVFEHVKDTFEAWFEEPNQAVSFTKAKRERLNPKDKVEQPLLEEEDDPETVIDGKIDLGELIVQHLSLALDLYPRKMGVRSNFGDPLEDAPEGTYDNPFAALKDWKIKEKKKD